MKNIEQLDRFVASDDTVDKGVESNVRREPVLEFYKGSFDGEMAPESEGLEPLCGGRVLIGSYWDINGAGAVLVDFRPTRAELKTLAYRYLESYEEVAAGQIAGYSGSRESRESAFAWRRFESIANALGSEPIKEFEDHIEKMNLRLQEVSEDVQKNGTLDQGKLD